MALNIEEWDKLSYSEKLTARASSPVDCSFLITTGVNVKTVGAHKSILAHSSSVFATMFNGSYKEANSSFEIPLPNVINYLDFSIILEYMYYKTTGALTLLTVERLKHVAYLAHYYMLNVLLEICHNQFEQKVNGNQIGFYDFIQAFEYETKLERKIKICGKEWFYQGWCFKSTELLTNTSIYDLEPQYFYELLKALVFFKFKASELFCLIENYAKIHGLKMENLPLQNIPNFDNSKDDVKSETAIQGKMLIEMFTLINFRQITAREFKKGPAVSKVWNVCDEEKLGILLTLVE